MQDDHGGGSRQFGFLFLYELLRGDFKVNDWLDVDGQNFNMTLGVLLVRSFHLKISNWGRDHSGREIRPEMLRYMAVLIMMLRFPEAEWPVLPEEVVEALKEGVSLTEDNDTANALKVFLRSLEHVLHWCQVSSRL